MLCAQEGRPTAPAQRLTTHQAGSTRCRRAFPYLEPYRAPLVTCAPTPDHDAGLWFSLIVADCCRLGGVVKAVSRVRSNPCGSSFDNAAKPTGQLFAAPGKAVVTEHDLCLLGEFFESFIDFGIGVVVAEQVGELLLVVVVPVAVGRFAESF